MNGFEKAYNNVRRGKMSLVREAIMTSCNWKSLSLFSQKKNGKRSITNEEAMLIRDIFKNEGIDADSGDLLMDS